jgi:hypothetical protein
VAEQWLNITIPFPQLSAAHAFNRFISPQITQINTDYGYTDYPQ